ncbi:MAG: hypothetical protein WBD20_19235 [Pirellulaceae bacterium]
MNHHSLPTSHDQNHSVVSQKLVVLLQRHLVLESQLASSLESLNDATAEALSHAGLRGPSAEDVQRLDPMTRDVQAKSIEVAQARVVLLERIHGEAGKQYSSIRAVIDGLNETVAAKLNEIRAEILTRCDLAQSGLINNQATLHYTFDFHRKYLAGVFQQDCEEQNYRANGQSQEPPRGNLFGRTC